MAQSVRLLASLQLPSETLRRIQQPAEQRLVEVLFYTGCNVLRTPHIVLNVMDILDALGLDNIVAQGVGGLSARGTMRRSLAAADAERAIALVPSATLAAPVVSRYLRVGYRDEVNSTQVLAAPAAFQQLLRVRVDRGRLLSETDEAASARVCVLGALLAQQLFGYRDPVSLTTIGAGAITYIVGPVTGTAIGATSAGRRPFSTRKVVRPTS